MLDHAPKDCGTSIAGSITVAPTEFAVAHPPPSFRMQCFNDRWTLPYKTFSVVRKALRSEKLCDPRPPSTWLQRLKGTYVHIHAVQQLLQLLQVIHSTWLQRHFPLLKGERTLNTDRSVAVCRSVVMSIAKTIRHTALCIKDLIDRRPPLRHTYLLYLLRP